MEIDWTRLQQTDAIIEAQALPLWIEAPLFRNVGTGDDLAPRNSPDATAKVNRRQRDCRNRGGVLGQSGEDGSFDMRAGRIADRQTSNRTGCQRLDAVAKEIRASSNDPLRPCRGSLGLGSNLGHHNSPYTPLVCRSPHLRQRLRGPK